MNKISWLLVSYLLLLGMPACSTRPKIQPQQERSLPITAVKVHPSEDLHPPQLHSSDWETPRPLPGPINTAGGEDSPFIPPSGESLFFFFTPDVALPAEEQVRDGQTGIYQSTRVDDSWGKPRRVILSDDLSLDGCPFVLQDTIWFCSVRPGTSGPEWFTAEYRDGSWANWQPADLNPAHQIGELHLTADGEQLFFGSPRQGTQGANDIWVSTWQNEGWTEPVNLPAVNSEADETRPFLTADGQELWFTRTYQGTPAVYRSRKFEGEWSTPELIVSQFAGEPTLDRDGNLYFVHHYYLDGEMIEADIYLARKK